MITIPSWHGSAVRLAKNYGMSERRIVAVPLGNIFGESSEAIPKIRESAEEVTRQIALALLEPVLAGRAAAG